MLAVCDAGRPVEIGAAKERALLAELVLHANQIVSRERLIEVVWGDTPPATAAATLNTYVSHLRSALEPGRAPRSQPGLLLTREPGYLLAVDPERVDALRFERLADEGRRALAAGDATTAAPTLREGLGLWRGGALADFVYEPFAQAEATRLEELRLATLEQRVDADLALGRHHDLVAELRRLVDEHPLRERLWGQLMLALYRSGRQSEALRAYGELREVLAEELGIDPSPALRRLEEDMLQQRLALEAPVGPAPAPVPAGPVQAPTNLPTRLTTFVGREDDIAEVARLCASTRLVTLVGAGGVGKTRLAVEVASRLVDEHPDGVFLVELAPLSDAGGLYQQVIASVGIGEDDRRSPAETLAAYLAGRRILLLIDNCEHLVDACAALVEELLTAGPGVRILATSRELLRVPVETAWRVPSMSTPPPDTGLGELVDFEAPRLFLERARTLSPGLELSKADAAHVARICARLEGIPLAIELAAARTRLLSIGEIAERLDDRFGLLSTGARTAPGRHQTLRAAVDWSYDSLTVAERHLFDLLSVFSGGFTLQAAEALCPDTELTPSTVLETVGNLSDKSMVLAGPGRIASRFRMLETLRQYGAERLAERGETEAARNRHLGWAVALGAEAEQHLEGARQAEWLQRLADEHEHGMDEPEPVAEALLLHLPLGHLEGVRVAVDRGHSRAREGGGHLGRPPAHAAGEVEVPCPAFQRAGDRRQSGNDQVQEPAVVRLAVLSHGVDPLRIEVAPPLPCSGAGEAAQVEVRLPEGDEGPDSATEVARCVGVEQQRRHVLGQSVPAVIEVEDLRRVRRPQDHVGVLQVEVEGIRHLLGRRPRWMFDQLLEDAQAEPEVKAPHDGGPRQGAEELRCLFRWFGHGPSSRRRDGIVAEGH